MMHFTVLIMLFLVLNLGNIEAINWSVGRGYSVTSYCKFTATNNVLSFTNVDKISCSNSCSLTPGCTHYYWSLQRILSARPRQVEYCSLRSDTIAKSDVQDFPIGPSRIYISSECGIKN